MHADWAGLAPQDIDVQLIDPDPCQSRTRQDPVALAALVESIARRGLLEPVWLRRSRKDPERYWAYAGGRRVQAFQELCKQDPVRWARIPAYVDPDREDSDALDTSLAENLHRSDLTALEQGRGMLRLMQLKGWNQEQLAAYFSKNYGHIRSVIAGTRIVLASPELLAADAEKPFPMGLLRNIPREAELQGRLVRAWRDWDDKPVKPLVNRIRQWRNHQSAEVPGAHGATRIERLRHWVWELRVMRDVEFWELGPLIEEEAVELRSLVFEVKETAAYLEQRQA